MFSVFGVCIDVPVLVALVVILLDVSRRVWTIINDMPQSQLQLPAPPAVVLLGNGPSPNLRIEDSSNNLDLLLMPGDPGYDTEDDGIEPVELPIFKTEELYVKYLTEHCKNSIDPNTEQQVMNMREVCAHLDQLKCHAENDDNVKQGLLSLADVIEYKKKIAKVGMLSYAEKTVTCMREYIATEHTRKEDIDRGLDMIKKSMGKRKFHNLDAVEPPQNKRRRVDSAIVPARPIASTYGDYAGYASGMQEVPAVVHVARVVHGYGDRLLVEGGHAVEHGHDPLVDALVVHEGEVGHHVPAEALEAAADHQAGPHQADDGGVAERGERRRAPGRHRAPRDQAVAAGVLPGCPGGCGVGDGGERCAAAGREGVSVPRAHDVGDQRVGQEQLAPAGLSVAREVVHECRDEAAGGDEVLHQAAVGAVDAVDEGEGAERVLRLLVGLGLAHVGLEEADHPVRVEDADVGAQPRVG
eukprot:764867-Hanusia_phi.AAC.8